MSGLFSSPDIPAPPKPPKPPKPEETEKKAQKEAREEEKSFIQKRRRSATLLTGAAGVEEPTRRRTILG